jgi:RNA polymerase sigma-70 factor (ECF subfamily)
MIKAAASGHHVVEVGMEATAAAVFPERVDAGARLCALFEAHFDFVWRSLRRLGMDEGAADDGAQEVFLVLSRKLGEVPEGKERSFLFGTALRVASDARRARSRRPIVADPRAIESAEADGAGADVLLERARTRAILDAILDEMEIDLRTVFVLYELEEMSMAEIASTLDVPAGTVASRLRRARADFAERVARHRARMAHGGAR